ncbi:hypothetical protein N7517_010829 [Penicillium concentricum]|uniref:Uncharacterized protein n=1 Tax=Penicillium concentricum TaxID=293559 RepID=A0A9W9RAX5_9EURO|nr:uncharacterized protein N7517_010829 [Penicillium concentricum]KAJ5356220.1 hypothetical protein N7517_010829 [Penicillium concentricum]
MGLNRVRPKVDNIEYHINFSRSSESGSPPAWFNETWDNDPEIRRFLFENEVSRDQVSWRFCAIYHIPRYEPNIIIDTCPSPSPAPPVLSQPAVVTSKLDHTKELASSSELYCA